MTWRLKVKHTTSFQYESEVSASFNEARMTPMNSSNQLLLQSNFSVSPLASVFEYQDYFGTQVKSFDVQAPHIGLTIESESTVDVDQIAETTLRCTWNELEEDGFKDRFDEYLKMTPLVNTFENDLELRNLSNPYEAVLFLNERISKRISYSPGATNVYTPASEAWAKGAGVCQDFTHISISILRTLGIPARYVSGYLYTGSGQIGETVIGESHSWVDVWIGDWYQFDPTNGRVVGTDHVIVAKGRDYHDVTPLKGIFSGGRSRKTDVVVSLTRLER
jgi:transglutaminase-like putative cysteine protease